MGFSSLEILNSAVQVFDARCVICSKSMVLRFDSSLTSRNISYVVLCHGQRVRGELGENAFSNSTSIIQYVISSANRYFQANSGDSGPLTQELIRKLYAIAAPGIECRTCARDISFRMIESGGRLQVEASCHGVKARSKYIIAGGQYDTSLRVCIEECRDLLSLRPVGGVPRPDRVEYRAIIGDSIGFAPPSLVCPACKGNVKFTMLRQDQFQGAFIDVTASCHGATTRFTVDWLKVKEIQELQRQIQNRAADYIKQLTIEAGVAVLIRNRVYGPDYVAKQEKIADPKTNVLPLTTKRRLALNGSGK